MLDDYFEPSETKPKTSGTVREETEKIDRLFKVLVIGEWAVGKTCYVRRYAHNSFTSNYKATIGVDFALKSITWDESTTIKLQLWDIQGQEYYGSMTRAYYREAVGALVVFDATRPKTFDEIIKWKNDLDDKVQLSDGTRIPAVLIANKCDIAPRESIINDANALDRFCRDHGFCGWFACSAKENIRIEESARYLISQILTIQSIDDRGASTSESGDVIKVDGPRRASETARSGTCSC